MWLRISLLLLWVISGCDTSETTRPEHDEPIAVRRIEAPQRLDTLRIATPFRMKASVDCHNPIIGLRVEFTDRSFPGAVIGDGEVLGSISWPAPGTFSVQVDSLLTIDSLSRRTADNLYGFILVAVYEGREYRAGFDPVVILD